MTINLSVPQQQDPDLSPRITIIGVGGAGGNAVNNMIESRLEGVEFLVANTDNQALAQALAERKIQLGLNITHGLGAGARPDIGRAAAEEAIDELVAHLQGAHMVFITAGMGGGTGTGAAPVIARLAREHGILTVGVVTKPFQFEGINRMRIAEAGIEEMQQFVDTLIVIPNQNLFRVANEKTTFADAFAMADEVLHSGVRGVTDLMVVPGLINLDFADIRTVMSEMGKAMMGTGEAEGENRATLAAEAAISNPLLDEVSMKGARGVLINITGGPDMTLFEVDESANRIGDEVDSDANIIFGSTMDPQMEGRMRVSVVATGIDAEVAAAPRPVLKVYSRPDPEPADAEVPLELNGTDGTPIEESAAEFAEMAPEDTVSSSVDRMLEEASVLLDETPEEQIVEAAPEPMEPMEHLAEERYLEPEPPMEQTEPVPQAAPVTERETAFIPPRPVDPRAPSSAEAAPDPFRAADLINGGAKTKERRLVPNLFQRMTGAAKPRPPAPAPKQEPSMAQPAETPQAPPREAPPPARVEQEQPPMDVPAPQERLNVSRSEEDLLDIPAFLRRQAN